MHRTFPAFFRSVALPLCLCLLGNSVSFAATKSLDASTAKQKVEERGIGNKARITESTGTEVDGTILSIDADSFQMQLKAGAPVSLYYSQVTVIRGPGLSKGAKWAIGIGIGVGAAAGITAIAAEHAFHSSPI